MQNEIQGDRKNDHKEIQRDHKQTKMKIKPHKYIYRDGKQLQSDKMAKE